MVADKILGDFKQKQYLGDSSNLLGSEAVQKDLDIPANISAIQRKYFQPFGNENIHAQTMLNFHKRMSRSSDTVETLQVICQ